MLPINTIFCIGRNYVAHIAELQNEIPSEPLVFLKPNSSVLFSGSPIVLPQFSDDVHYETELVLQIGQDCDGIAPDAALSLVSGYAVGLDLTARDVQTHCKSKGLPWTKAKGFRGAACLSDFVAAERLAECPNITFSLRINHEWRQSGQTDLMIYPIPVLLSYLSAVYGLRRGDVVFTGTPVGVGRLYAGDVLDLDLQEGMMRARFEVVAS